MAAKGASEAGISDQVFHERLGSHRDQFEPRFKDYFNDLKKEKRFPKTSKLSPKTLELIEDLSLRGGKRQRVAFLYEGFLLSAKSKAPDYLFDCAVSIELLQTHLLLHDDIVDDSPLRRGKITTFHAFKKMFPKNPKAALGLSIMAGDIAAYLSIKVITESKMPDWLKTKVAKIQLQAGIDTFYGQIYDIERDMKLSTTDKELLILADWKATRSSGIAPMLIGLAVAGSDTPENIDKIIRYNTVVGYAWQFQDDYLGMFGDPRVTGKSINSDIIEGKRTIMVNYALKQCSPRERKFIESVLGNDQASEGACDQVRDIVRKYGGDTYLKEVAERFAIQGERETKSWRSWNKESIQFFAGAATWTLKREL